MNTAMRTPKDRVRHTILFEILLLVLCVPLLSFLLGKPLKDVGVMSAMLSIISAVWNYIYNYLFDHALLKLEKPLYPRSSKLRLTHALLFELTLLTISIPTVMIYLECSFIKALMVDIGFVAFVPVYAYVFNVMYDRVFPPPAAQLI